jgi:hypothetical protein
MKETTVLDALLASLEKVAVHNDNVQVSPAVVLWPDQDQQWLPLMPVLREVLPYLLTREYEPSTRTGPATWGSFEEFITLASGRSVVSGADWGPGRVELGYGNNSRGPEGDGDAEPHSQEPHKEDDRTRTPEDGWGWEGDTLRGGAIMRGQASLL